MSMSWALKGKDPDPKHAVRVGQSCGSFILNGTGIRMQHFQETLVRIRNPRLRMPHFAKIM
jgi:hypothetical protein